MVWLVVVCGCDRGELFRCGLSVLNVLNNCDVVSWMRCGSAWSRFVFSWGEFEFVSSSFVVFIFVCLLDFGLLF